MGEWFDDEKFWIETYPFLFRPERLEAADNEVDKILRLISFQGASVLDLCCGPGRHSMALAKRGLKVTGVDKTSFLLDKARERGLAEKVSVEWVLQDMREFMRPEAYDLVLSLFTSFGYFDNKDDDRKVLRNIFLSLKPGGTLVMDMSGKEWVAKVFQPSTSEKLPDGSLLVERHEIIDGWSRIKNEWIIIRKGKVRSFKFLHRIYSGQELKDTLLGAGFEEVSLFGDFDGNEYGYEAKRLVVVARKARS